MEFKYIFAIAVLGVFFLLIFISFAFLEYGRIKEEKLQAWIMEQYSNEKVKDYEYAEDNSEEISSQSSESDSVKEEKEEESVPELHLDDPYGKIDIEGIEEITGNYNGDK